MSLFSFDLFNSRSKEEQELQAVVDLLQKMNVAVSSIVAFAKTSHNPEIGLEQSIRDSLYLLDSSKDTRESNYIKTSSSFYGRAVTGKLQRIDALEENLKDLFKQLEEFENG